MSIAKKPLKPSDFPVNADAKKIKKQDGTPIANTDDPAVVEDVADRLNDDEARRDEDQPDPRPKPGFTLGGLHSAVPRPTALIRPRGCRSEARDWHAR